MQIETNALERRIRTSSLMFPSEDLGVIDKLLLSIEDVFPASEWLSSGIGVYERGIVGALAFFPAPINEPTFQRLLDKTKLQTSAREQADNARRIPCLRHGIRLDDIGGLSLYSERDMEKQLCVSMCNMFGARDVLAEAVHGLGAKPGISIAGFGIDWLPDIPARLRFYLVATGSRNKDKQLFFDLQETFGKKVFSKIAPVIERIINTPRRLYEISFQDGPDGITLKLELQNVSKPEIEALISRPINSAANKFLHSLDVENVSRFGVRIHPDGSTTTAFYFPILENMGG